MSSPSSNQGASLAEVHKVVYKKQNTKHQDVPAPATSLAATCSKALTTAPLNTAELENLPQHMLVQLLGQVVSERDKAEAQVNLQP